MTLACSPSLSLLQDVKFMTQAFRRQLVCHLVAKEKKEKKGRGCKNFGGGCSKQNQKLKKHLQLETRLQFPDITSKTIINCDGHKTVHVLLTYLNLSLPNGGTIQTSFMVSTNTLQQRNRLTKQNECMANNTLDYNIK